MMSAVHYNVVIIKMAGKKISLKQLLTHALLLKQEPHKDLQGLPDQIQNKGT